ncbi:MAG: type II toxin-antitoxin system RelE/ParE family toxin [Bacteroidota bacterium]
MAYQIVIKPSAQKDLDNLPDNEVLRITRKLEQIAEEPRSIGVQKLTGEEGYRIRSGNYRILFEIDDEKKIVFIYRIKHRKEVYR